MKAFQKILLNAVMLLVITGYAIPTGAQSQRSDNDRATFEQWLSEGMIQHQNEKDIHKLIAFYGQKQLGIPYQGGLLEVPPVEQLVVTLEGSDCVLFVEYTLALTLTTLQGSSRYEDFASNVALFRYIDGNVDGYTSRLHYFSDWLNTNQQKGLLTVLHQDKTHLPTLSPTHFMTSNRGSYRQLKSSDKYFMEIKNRESMINKMNMRYIPQHLIRDFELTFKTGDIVSFVSTIDGLDIAHTGLIVVDGDKVGFYHASTTGSVIKDPKSVYRYTIDRRNVNGIIVARLKTPD